MPLNGLICLGYILGGVYVFCYNSNAFAGETVNPTPTLDKITAAATADNASYTLTPLTDTLPEGAVEVTINNTKYYYTPEEGADINTLQALANIGGNVLVEVSDGSTAGLTYEVDGKSYTYDTAKLPQSGYTLTPATAKGDTTITLYEAGENGTLTSVYYNVTLKKTAYGEGDKTLTFGWEKNADTNRLEFKQNPANPVGKVITYKYYDLAAIQNSRISNTTDRSGDVFKGIFINQNTNNTSGTAYGGAIYNYGTSAKLGDISADFINNYATSVSNTAAGGAIFSRYGTIGNIIGDFVSNHAESKSGAVWGGAILNWDGNIGNITGDFIGNYIVSSTNVAKGGAIHNDNATIKNITGDFIGNHASGTNVYGGAIYNTTKGTIGDITGNFIGNYALGSSNTFGGAIYNEKGTLGNITGDFIGNYASGSSTYGGAVYNSSGTIGDIAGDFIGNYVSGSSSSYGGAVYNNNGKIRNITGNFVGNYVSGNSANGGAIYNTGSGSIDSITGHFTDNSVVSMGVAYGGAIFNNSSSAKIGNLNADFINNHAVSTPTTAAGGAIYNYYGKIDNIKGNFIGNYAQSTSGAVWGGAILNWYGTIGSITGDFRGNSIASTNNIAKGGAIHNDSATIVNIAGNFINNNAASTKNNVYGGAIYNTTTGNIGDITGDFIGNYASSANGKVLGGAIYNVSSASIGEIKGDFIGNYASSANGEVLGGAIYNTGTIGLISGSFTKNSAKGETAFGGAVYNISNDVNKPLEFVNANFENNSAVATSGKAYGGAVFGNALKFMAKGQNSLFSGNTAGGKSNAIYVAGLGSIGLNDGTNAIADTNDTEAKVEFAASEGGKILIYDDVDGINYDMLINGDGNEESDVFFGGNVAGVRNLELTATSVMHLGETAAINAVNYSAAEGAMLKLDVAFNETTQKTQNGVLNISGDVEGKTNVIVNVIKSGKFENLLPFVIAPNDDNEKTPAEFILARVVGSAREWKSERNIKGNETGSIWYLSITPTDEPDKPVDPDKPTKPVYVPEVAAYAGLMSAAVEQNRSIANSVERGIAFKKSTLCYQESCGVAELMPKKRAWIDVAYDNAKIDSPQDMDAKIYGTTLGLDFYRIGEHRAGLFGAYRRGKYDLSGRGKYYAAKESDITNKSYLGGAYYQYDNDDVKLTGTAFGGKQHLEIKTDDRVAFAKTHAKQYGASVDVEKSFILDENLIVSPSVGAYYTTLDVDSLNDNVGKEAKFERLHYLETEAGVKVETVACNNGKTGRLYIKPALVQTFASGGKTTITDVEGNVKPYAGQTLGRIEVGGEAEGDEGWTCFARTGVTFGSNYRSYNINAGLSYAF